MVVSPGWNLTEGTIPFSRQSEADVIRLVNLALSPAKKHATTYKYAFFKAVLDNLFNVDLQTCFLRLPVQIITQPTRTYIKISKTFSSNLLEIKLKTLRVSAQIS